METILFQGDSITDANRVRTSDHDVGKGYAAIVKSRLEAKFPGRYRFMNRGIGGDRLEDLYMRRQRDVFACMPDYLSILVGVNDVWQDLNDPGAANLAGYERLLNSLLEEVEEKLPKAKLMILEPFALPGTVTGSPTEMVQPNRWDCFCQGIRLCAQACKHAAEIHGALFVPLQQDLDVETNPAAGDYLLPDGVHPSEMGHRWIGSKWLEAFLDGVVNKNVM